MLGGGARFEVQKRQQPPADPQLAGPPPHPVVTPAPVTHTDPRPPTGPARSTQHPPLRGSAGLVGGPPTPAGAQAGGQGHACDSCPWRETGAQSWALGEGPRRGGKGKGPAPPPPLPSVSWDGEEEGASLPGAGAQRREQPHPLPRVSRAWSGVISSNCNFK